METTTNPDPSAVAATRAQPSPKRPHYKASAKVLPDPEPSVPPETSAPFSAPPIAQPTDNGTRPVILIDAPSTQGHPEGLLDLSIKIGRAAHGKRGRLAGLVIISLLLLGGGAYLAWGLALPQVVTWANKVSWHWSLGWIAVVALAGGPVYALMLCGSAILSALGFFEELNATKDLDELDEIEGEIRGSADPIDYARYGRKALQAYYNMGQNQVRLSFYAGVAVMTFGFAFLLAGFVVQALDTAALPYLRPNPDIKFVTVGGGLIIELVAVAFLWIYRNGIMQQAVYYRRQMLVHSALFSVPIAAKMQQESSAALRSIVDAVISPDWENRGASLPKVGRATGTKEGALLSKGSSAPKASNGATGRGHRRNGRGRQSENGA